MPGLSAVVFLCAAAYSQTADAPHKFEVASIKPSAPNAPTPTQNSPAVFNLNATAKMLIQIGYNLHDYELAGGPKWMDTDFYLISAKAPAGEAPEDQKSRTALNSERVRYLLEERFQFASHRETKSLKGYALVVGKDGPKLKEIAHDDAKFRVRMGKGFITTQGGAKVGLLASILINDLQCPVVDETGLSGYYDLQLKYSKDETSADAGPTLLNALEEQLGLRLEPRRVPVPVLTIDRLERPTGN